MEEEKPTKNPIRFKPITWAIIFEALLGFGVVLQSVGFLASLLDRGSTTTFREFLNDITQLQLYNFGVFITLAFLILIYKFQENILTINREINRWKLRLEGAIVFIIVIFLLSTIGVRNITNQLIVGYLSEYDIGEEKEVAIIPTNTPTQTPTPSSTPTPTSTPTKAPPPTATPTFTITPSPTPWLVEKFSADKLNERRWQSSTCSYPYYQYVVGAPVIVLDGKEFNTCYLTALLDEYEVNKILVEFKLVSSYARAGFACLRTSCGEAPLDFEFDSLAIRYRIAGGIWKEIKPHSLDMPVGITLIIEWLANETILLSAYETQNMELIRETSLECSVAPQFVRVGASTSDEFAIILHIEQVELSGPAMD